MVTECDIPPAQFLSEKPDKALKRAGVYAILCDVNGKYYVGSSINIGRRFQQHALELRMRRHISPKLRGSYNKYGATSLLAVALEYVDGSQTDLLQAEKQWIEKLDAVKSGLNISEEPCGNRGIKRSPEIRKKLSAAMLASNQINGRSASFQLVSPTGQIHSGVNIANFCRKNGLLLETDKNCLGKVINGDAISHKGWRTVGGRGRKQREDKPFCLIPPLNTPIRGLGIKAFCKANGLHYPNIASLLRGERKQSEGWTCGDGALVIARSRKVQAVRRLASPSGETIEFRNMAEFCRTNGLCVSAVLQVMNGKRPHHKQWRKSQC